MSRTTSHHSSNCKISLVASLFLVQHLLRPALYQCVHVCMFACMPIRTSSLQYAFINCKNTECSWRYTKLINILYLMVFTFEWIETDNK